PTKVDTARLRFDAGSRAGGAAGTPGRPGRGCARRARMRPAPAAATVAAGQRGLERAKDLAPRHGFAEEGLPHGRTPRLPPGGHHQPRRLGTASRDADAVPGAGPGAGAAGGGMADRPGVNGRPPGRAGAGSLLAPPQPTASLPLPATPQPRSDGRPHPRPSRPALAAPP